MSNEVEVITAEHEFREGLRAIVRHDRSAPYEAGEPSASGEPSPQGGRWMTPAEHAGKLLQRTSGLAILTPEERGMIEWALNTCVLPDENTQWIDAQGEPASPPRWARGDVEADMSALAKRIGGRT